MPRLAAGMKLPHSLLNCNRGITKTWFIAFVPLVFPQFKDSFLILERIYLGSGFTNKKDSGKSES